MYLFMVPTYFDSTELNNGFDWIFEVKYGQTYKSTHGLLKYLLKIKTMDMQ